jgi:DNA repair exonuclease SbcCD nuclease subunit
VVPTLHNQVSMVRFIHTADLQLGLMRRFLDEDARARYAQARFDVLASIGQLAASEDAAFVIVAGDVFETNRVRPRTVMRAFDALASCPVPVYLLPGGHDPLDAASVYRSPTFARSKPTNVAVLDSTVPIEPLGAPGITIVGAPWLSRHPLTDLASEAVAGLAQDADPKRILVAHGPLDTLDQPHQPHTIGAAALDAAIAERRIGYVALGGHHATTRVGDSGRMWYAGTPEPTDFDGTDVGNALVVDLDGDRCDVLRRTVGGWRLRSEVVELGTGLGTAALRARLDMLPAKDRTVIRPVLRGTISLTDRARVDRIIEDARAWFASIEEPAPDSGLVVRPTDADFADLGLTGFASAAVARLRQLASGTDETAAVALDALSLLIRLGRGDGAAA